MYKCTYCEEIVMRVYKGCCMDCAKFIYPELDSYYLFTRSRINSEDEIKKYKKIPKI